MNSIQSLYGPLDNLAHFVHPVFGRTSYLLAGQVMEYAKKISDSICSSGRKNIVVSETGARPLAYVCERLLEGNSIDWRYMKFPRDPTVDLRSIMKFYMTESEKERMGSGLNAINQYVRQDSLNMAKRSLSGILQDIGRSKQSGLQKIVSQTIEGTEISDFISSPFLYFDEYIDSGTTLQNANMYFNYFSGHVDFKTVSYFTFIRNSQEYDRIHSTLFDLDTEEESFRNGAYPFENRIDLIGYFYYLDGSDYQKITLEDMESSVPGSSSLGLVEDIRAIVQDENLFLKYLRNFSIPCVKKYLQEDHLVRQFLMTLEKSVYGNGPGYEFLWQLADMYGPVWSPMPKINHLDFFDGTKRSDGLIRSARGFERLQQDYGSIRDEVLSQAASVCLNRKREWFLEIDGLLEVGK